MKNQVLLVQGGGEGAHDEWDNKILESLEPRLILGGIFLVSAPFVGDGGWHSEDIEPLTDIGAKLPEQTPIYLYHGS